MNLSKPYTLPPGRLNLRMVSKPVANPKKLPENAPNVVIPANMRDFYLLVSSNPKNTVAPVHMQVINANSPIPQWSDTLAQHQPTPRQGHRGIAKAQASPKVT